MTSFPEFSSTIGHPRLLPRARQRLIGREVESKALSLMLLDQDVSLVTVTGPGGVGKTTLAAHVAGMTEASFPGGVIVVPLAQISEPAYLLHAVGQALELRETGQTPIGDQLIERFSGPPALLVFDTFEHLVEAASQVARLIAECPNLTCLVTSRTPLHLRDEQEFPLRPLHTESGGLAGAVTLFLERATAADPSFTLTDENAEDVAAICRRLDGLPLAIELAAARIRLLPPGTMLSKLDDPLPLLTSGVRDLPARQRTMRDTIAWSYELLDPEVQRLFRQLAVFQGSFSLDAVEGIAGPGANVLSGLSTLLDQSLLEPVRTRSEARYRLLDTVREFGIELLREHEESESALANHAVWFRDLIEQAATAWWGAEHFEWLEQIELDIDNLRAALSRFDRSVDLESAARLAIAMYGVWRVHGPVSEGWNRYQSIVKFSEELSVTTRARLHLCLNGLEWVFADKQSGRWDSTGYQLAVESGDEEIIAMALVFEGATSESTGDLERAVSALSELADRGRNAQPGSFSYQWMPAALEHLAAVERGLGNIDRALELARGAADAAEARGFAWGYPMVLATLADIERLSGLRDASAAHYREAIQLIWPQRQPRHSAAILAGYAALAADEGDHVLAARLAGAATRLVEADGVVLPAYCRTGFNALKERLRLELGEDLFGEETATGKAWSEEVAKVAAEDSIAARATPAEEPETSPVRSLISPREVEVLALLVEGKTDAEIAEVLFISRSTAGDHVSSILAKLDVPNRVAAAVFALRNGMV
ncbi:LuxR C-terminal-related transcriptional regulator [soil metagenome]